MQDELREKYKWSKRKKQKYNDIFNRLVILSEAAKANSANEDVLEISGGDDDIDENGETASDAIEGIGTADVPAAGDTATTPASTSETNK